MHNYTDPTIWNITWARPYHNYEKHHQLFWKRIREESRGYIVDMGCGTGSCWKETEGRYVAGYDFSQNAIEEARKNCPRGEFFVADIENDIPFPDGEADTVVLCGVVNYYEDLTKLLNQVKRLIKVGGKIIITINVIDDFPDRHWDFDKIIKEFSGLGYVRPEFTEKVGWFIVVHV